MRPLCVLHAGGPRGRPDLRAQEACASQGAACFWAVLGCLSCQLWGSGSSVKGCWACLSLRPLVCALPRPRLEDRRGGAPRGWKDPEPVGLSGPRVPELDSCANSWQAAAATTNHNHEHDYDSSGSQPQPVTATAGCNLSPTTVAVTAETTTANKDKHDPPPPPLLGTVFWGFFPVLCGRVPRRPIWVPPGAQGDGRLIRGHTGHAGGQHPDRLQYFHVPAQNGTPPHYPAPADFASPALSVRTRCCLCLLPW